MLDESVFVHEGDGLPGELEDDPVLGDLVDNWGAGGGVGLVAGGRRAPAPHALEATLFAQSGQLGPCKEGKSSLVHNSQKQNIRKGR